MSNKGTWSSEDKQKFKELVVSMGMVGKRRKNWTIIALHFERNARQCASLYKQLLGSKEIVDPNYVVSNGKAISKFRRARRPKKPSVITIHDIDLNAEPSDEEDNISAAEERDIFHAKQYMKLLNVKASNTDQLNEQLLHAILYEGKDENTDAIRHIVDVVQKRPNILLDDK